MDHWSRCRATSTPCRGVVSACRSKARHGNGLKIQLHRPAALSRDVRSGSIGRSYRADRLPDSKSSKRAALAALCHDRGPPAYYDRRPVNAGHPLRHTQSPADIVTPHSAQFRCRSCRRRTRPERGLSWIASERSCGRCPGPGTLQRLRPVTSPPSVRARVRMSITTAPPRRREAPAARRLRSRLRSVASKAGLALHVDRL